MRFDGAKEVLKCFRSDPSARKYVREVERECSLSYERVHHYLRELEACDAVFVVPRGRNREYAVNRESELVEKIFSLIEFEKRAEFFDAPLKQRAAVQGLVRDILGAASVHSVLLENPDSEGEGRLVLLVGRDLSGREYDAVKAACEKHSSRINFVVDVHTTREFAESWKGKAYVEKWLDGVILFGEDFFWKEAMRLGF